MVAADGKPLTSNQESVEMAVQSPKSPTAGDYYPSSASEKYSLDRSSVSSDRPLKDENALEAQMPSSNEPTPAPVEYTVSTSKKLIFLGLYFFLSLGLTLSNKAVMKKVSRHSLSM